MLVLAAPFEFIPANGAAPSDEVLQTLVGVYDGLHYDLGLLAPQEAEALAKAKAGTPTNFKTMPAISSEVVQAGDLKLGIVFLTMDPDQRLPVPADMLEKALAEARSLADDVDLVVGLSGWGIAAEKQLLDISHGEFDLMLGAGSGTGLQGRLEAGGKTLWSRPFSKGKSPIRIDILAVPKDDAPWVLGQNIGFRGLPLTEDLPEDPAVAATLQKLPAPPEPVLK